MTDANVYKGLKNQGEGRAFQDEIELRAGSVPGLLLIPQYPQVNFFSGGVGKVTGEAWPDYLAIYKGTTLMFDAKSTGQERYFRPSSRDQHQFHKMILATEARFMAGYMVRWQVHSTVEFFPVYGHDQWPMRFEYGSGPWRYLIGDNFMESFCRLYLRPKGLSLTIG